MPCFVRVLQEPVVAGNPYLPSSVRCCKPESFVGTGTQRREAFERDAAGLQTKEPLPSRGPNALLMIDKHVHSSAQLETPDRARFRIKMSDSCSIRRDPHRAIG